MSVYVIDTKYGRLEPHYFKNHGAKPDRFGKTEGFRCGETNISEDSVYYRNLDDLADHLLANPSHGVRVSMPSASPSLYKNGVFIRGVAR